MRFFTIGSGSSGNCSFLGTDNTRILIDAGISGKRTITALNENDVSLSDIDGILITHEHRDHISCLGVLLRKHPIKVYATADTIKAILSSDIIGEVDPELFIPILKNTGFLLGDMNITPMPISHDAADPVAYRIDSGNKSFGCVTDLGKYDDDLINNLKDLDAILIEANHDIRMLETGIYPYYLKQRISSDFGHLSNEDCGVMLSRLLHDDFKWALLGHLSAENNYDKLCKESVCLEITMADCPYRAGDFPINVARRKEKGDILNI